MLVGFDYRPQSRQIIRDALRLSQGLHADLLAVSVELEGYPAFMRKVTSFLRSGTRAQERYEEMRRRIQEHALFAEDLGAEVIRTQSNDIARALVEVAHRRHVTQIVIGQPTRRRWEEFVYGSVVNRLLRLSTDIDIHIVPFSRKRKRGE